MYGSLPPPPLAFGPLCIFCSNATLIFYVAEAHWSSCTGDRMFVGRLGCKAPPLTSRGAVHWVDKCGFFPQLTSLQPTQDPQMCMHAQVRHTMPSLPQRVTVAVHLRRISKAGNGICLTFFTFLYLFFMACPNIQNKMTKTKILQTCKP